MKLALRVMAMALLTGLFITSGSFLATTRQPAPDTEWPISLLGARDERKHTMTTAIPWTLTAPPPVAEFTPTTGCSELEAAMMRRAANLL